MARTDQGAVCGARAADERLGAGSGCSARRDWPAGRGPGRLDQAIGEIDEARTKQTAAPGLQESAKKALATLNREWDGLTAHREYPMISLDNYPDGVVMPMSAVRGGSAAGQGGALAA